MGHFRFFLVNVTELPIIKYFETWPTSAPFIIIVGNAGVPQGSILGPLLLFIYSNDITEIVESDMTLFSDDVLKKSKTGTY